MIVPFLTPQLLLANVQTSISDAAVLGVVGLTIVFAALALVLLCLTVVTRLGASDEAPAAADSSPETAADAARDDSIPPQELAVITAAAVAALRRPVRITRVRRLHANPDSVWSAHGRIVVQASHQLRKRYSP